MTRKPTAKRPSVAKPGADGLDPLIAEVRELIRSARRGVASVVDTFQVLTNLEIGRRIVEHEQKGEKRAAYGAEVLKELSARLTEEFGKGFSAVNLSYMKRFYLLWGERVHILQTPSEQLASGNIFQTLPEKSGQAGIRQTSSGKFKTPFTLSWSHYVELLLCKEKKAAVVELTLPKDANIHAKEYQLYLPSKELLQTKLLEWTREEEAKA